MASGKSRSTKRSSGTSYSSTIIVTFIALSLLFLWLLTSNSFNAQPQYSASPSATKTPKPIEPIAQSHHSEKPSLAHQLHHVVDHEDIPTHLPHDDTNANNNNNNNKETPDHKKDTFSDPDTSSYSNRNSNDQEYDESKTDNNVITDESSLKEEDKEEKQMTLETRKQEPEQKTADDQNRHVDSERDQRKKVHDQQEITDEDQQQRIDEHQKQEDDQIEPQKQEWQSRDPHGAISLDQIEHDEAPIDESNETKESWSTQADQSVHQNERRKSGPGHDDKNSKYEYTWRLCNATTGADYIPCLDNEKVIAKIHNRKHHEHRERHCPEQPPVCLVPLPRGYQTRIDWPQSRDKIWYHNVPHKALAEVKGHQNWVKVNGEFLTFPGGGTQFIHGALHYIDFLQEAVPEIAWGKHSRVVLDVGCGVASLGGYLFERDVLTMSFAPKDEHEAQVQMALERGIPAISAVMGSHRLPFPSRVFDVVHCARCRVPWHEDGGALLLELNRVLRPGGYFVWSATPVYQKLEEDVNIWKEMSNLTVSMCWELVTIKKDTLNSIGAAIYQKPDSNDCYDQRKQNHPPMCKSHDDPNAAWGISICRRRYVPLQSCMHRTPLEENERGSQWPEEWPDRLQMQPYWLNGSEVGIYGKPAPEDFASDYKHWKKMVGELYINGLGISWSRVRNVMDMRAVYGGFAAALKDHKIWVMNVVNIDSPDTLPIIYERGLFGIYHDWCESFSTYPRTYDLLHADHLFSTLKKRCKMVIVMAEIDRIVRPGGKLIVRDDASTIGEVEDLLKSLHWKVYFPKNQEGILAAEKSDWRPDSYADPS
ncbi:hypothetical protein OROHE_024334 [Orobanche hederae]